MFILASRGRPHNIERLARAWRNTVSEPRPVWLRLDEDDPRLAAYQALALPIGWHAEIGPRTDPCAALNEAFAALGHARFYGVLADDVVPETPGWDAALIEAAMQDPAGLAYGNDGIQGAALATHPVIAGDFARALGWIALPGLARLYADNVWTEIARARGVLRYLPEVKLMHRHFSNGAPMDATYAKPEAGRDRAVYDRWARNFANAARAA